MWIKALDDGPDLLPGVTRSVYAMHEGAHAVCDGDSSCESEDESTIDNMVENCTGGGIED